MSQISNKQGAIKASEVSADNSQEVINTSVREDLLTITNRLSKVCEDIFKRHQCFILSSGELTWDSPDLKIPSTTMVEFVIMTNSLDGSSRSVRCQFQPLSLATWNLTGLDFIYIELSRTEIESNSTITLTDGISGSGTAGKRIRAASSLPRISDLNDGNPESTLSIPIVYKNSTNIWWIPSGMLWPNGTVSEIGNTTKIVNIPLGTIVGVHIPNQTDIATINQAYVDANFPGFWLCDGSLIVSSNPIMNGQVSPSLNNPIAIAPRDKGRFIRGANKSGTTGGSDTVTLVSSEMPSHYHTLAAASHGSHSHNVVNSGGSQLYLNTTGGSGSGSVYVDSDSSFINLDYYTNRANHLHTLGSLGVATAHENIPQSVSLVYIIKVL